MDRPFNNTSTRPTAACSKGAVARARTGPQLAESKMDRENSGLDPFRFKWINRPYSNKARVPDPFHTFFWRILRRAAVATWLLVQVAYIDFET